MKKRPLVVGITGGIGSGKSTCSKVFSLLGIQVYDSDSRAKDLYNEDEALREGVMALFGASVYKGGKLDKKALGKAVFGFPEKLRQLEALVHPRVHADRNQWISEQKSDYVLIEAAILIESGGYKSCDRVIHVSASEKERIRRVQLRDQNTVADIEKRLKLQLSDQERLAHAHFEIINEGKHLVIPQILEIDELLRDLVRKN